MLPKGRSRDSFSTGCAENEQIVRYIDGEDSAYLGTRNTQEANRHEHTRNRHLIVSELDPIKVLHTQAVRGDQTIQCEDLVHLDRSDESAATLSNDMCDCETSAIVPQVRLLKELTCRYVRQFRGEGSGTRGIAELDLRYLILGVHISHLVGD
jgi:hypothetical protein